MKILKLTQFGNPILRKKAKTLLLGDLKKMPTKNLIKQMFFTMKKASGVGLAAPQIGKSLRLAVIEIKKSKIRPRITPLKQTVIINPKIISASKKMVDDWEGCLSLPDVRAKVSRPESIVAEYCNEEGEKKQISLKGFQARVFQHEIDHLNGVLYIDKVVDVKTIMTKDEFKKRIVGKGGLKSR